MGLDGEGTSAEQKCELDSEAAGAEQRYMLNQETNMQ
jgi:hypothetical protein